MQFKICVIGHFGQGKNLVNGQTVKTKIITEELQRQLGEDKILKIDTHGGLKTLLKAPFQVFRALKKSENVIIFPAQNGLRVYAPLLIAFRHFLKERKLHYIVIGGWLPAFLNNKKVLTFNLKKFDSIHVETTNLQTELHKQGFSNVYLMPNCKSLVPISIEEQNYDNRTPYRLCTFSRVMIEKGIEDIVDAVIALNNEMGRTVYTLDIYGPVDPMQQEWFSRLSQSFPHYITYRGTVHYYESVDVLKQYFALIFPTRFYTEGVPGSIIDAFAAGVPVIAARWGSFDDVIDQGSTGYGYRFGDISELLSLLREISRKPEMILRLKQNCVVKSISYLPETVVNKLIDIIVAN